jgi:hypothetical protein
LSDGRRSEIEHLRQWLCRVLLELERRICPDRPQAPERLPPGTAARPVEVEDGRFERLVRAAAAPDENPARVVWYEADAEVVVHLDRTRVRAIDGLVLVALTLECDQTGVAEVVVPFAVGTDKRPAGLVAASEAKPRGPQVLVDRWGEAIVATAWRAVVDAATTIARDRGSDLDGAPLRAGALVARGGRIAVVPQARHSFERARMR